MTVSHTLQRITGEDSIVAAESSMINGWRNGKIQARRGILRCLTVWSRAKLDGHWNVQL